MLDSYISSIMNMTADIYTQQNEQSARSGVITREWAYDRTIPCKVEPLGSSSGGGSRYDNKKFDAGSNKEYVESLQLKMKCLVPFSKRWRVTNIRSNDGQQVFIEIDKYDTPDTTFDVIASHPVLDPFGKISYYEVTLQRVHIQSDNTTAR